MTSKNVQGFASGNIPQAGGQIRAASRQEVLAVWREVDPVNLSVPREDADGFARGNIPKSGSPIAGTCHQILAIRREVYPPYIRRVTGENARWRFEGRQAS